MSQSLPIVMESNFGKVQFMANDISDIYLSHSILETKFEKYIKFILDIEYSRATI